MTSGQSQENQIVIVSGLPRSGTSMMMRVLQAGGIPPLTDELRTADVDNPKGYFEFERVKRLPQGDVEWLERAHGKCVKVISALLTYLPAAYNYQVIFMHRRMGEVLDSQRKMLTRLGTANAADDAVMAAVLQKHVGEVRAWLAGQANFALFDADYNAMLADPAGWVARLGAFLDRDLDAVAMEAAVDATLYRNRTV